MPFFPRWPVLLLFLSLLTLAVRLPNLLNVPIQSDEGGYLHSSVLIQDDFFANWDIPMRRFFGPTGFLYMWITAFFLNMVQNPLLAARIVSVLAGLGTGIGIFFLGKKVFNPGIGLLAMLLFALSPIHVLSDRTAVMDSLLGTMYIWMLVFAVQVALIPQWRWAILTGVFLGLSIWTKPTGRLFFAVIPMIIMLAQWKKWRAPGADANARHPKWIAMLLGVSLLIGLVFLAFLNLSSSAEYAEERTRQLAQSTETILLQPWVPVFENGVAVIGMIQVYYGAPFLLALLLVSGMLFGKNQARLRTLILLFAVSIGGILLLGITFGSKYIYYATLPLLLMVAAAIVYVPRKLPLLPHRLIAHVLTGILFVALAIPMLWQDVIFLFDPINDHYFQRDKGWAGTASCYGCNEILERISSDVGHDTPAIVIAEGISGHLWSTFSALLYDHKNIEVRRFERVLNFIPEGKDEARKRDYYRIILDENAETWGGKRVYLVLHNDLPTPFEDDRITLLYELKKPTTPEFSGDYWIRLFLVNDTKT